MQRRVSVALSLVLLSVALTTPAGAGWPGDPAKCPLDAVKVGATCVDKYEASVWKLPAASLTTKAGKAVIAKIQKGKATGIDLVNIGAMQLAPAGTCASASDYGTSFPASGNWTPVAGTDPLTPGIYAVSILGVPPSACITWFQAEQACALANKRLVRNQEWQRAAASTPDPGTDNMTTDCNVGSPGPVNTGARSSCKSAWGLFDMVGNVSEWVGDWGDQATGCTNWNVTYGGDASCVGGNGSIGFRLPGALVRGGYWGSNATAGPFAIDATFDPSLSSADNIGFRCAR